jgi:hypothetical protein
VCVFCTYDVFFLLELLQEVGRLEVLGHGVVEARNHLVDGLLPRLFGVLAALDGLEDHEPEVGGHLRKEPAVSQSVGFAVARGLRARRRDGGRRRCAPTFFLHTFLSRRLGVI